MQNHGLCPKPATIRRYGCDSRGLNPDHPCDRRNSADAAQPLAPGSIRARAVRLRFYRGDRCAARRDKALRCRHNRSPAGCRLPGHPPPGGAVIAEPLPPAGGAAVAVAPAAPAAAGPVGRTDLLGGWTIASSGNSCQLFMTLTSWTGGYRASTRGCASAAAEVDLRVEPERLAGGARRAGRFARRHAAVGRRHPLRRPDRRRRPGLLLPLGPPSGRIACMAPDSGDLGAGVGPVVAHYRALVDAGELVSDPAQVALARRIDQLEERSPSAASPPRAAPSAGCSPARRSPSTGSTSMATSAAARPC